MGDFTPARLDTKAVAVSATTSPDRHPVVVYLARLAPGSRRSVAQSLNVIAALVSGSRADAMGLPWNAITYQYAQALRAQLAEAYAPATANKHLAAFRGVMKETWRLGYIDADHYHRVSDVEAVKGERVQRGRALSFAELSAVFSACDDTAIGVRDRAIFALLAGTGLRRESLVSLDFEDINFDANEIHVRRMKGNKQTRVPMTEDVCAMLMRYVAARGTSPGALFVRASRSRALLLGHRLTTQAIYLLCRDRAKQAGIATFSPHDLRRTLATTLFEKGVDVSAIKSLLAHANVTTTLRYDRRGDEAKRKAAAAFDLPK